MSRRGSPMVPVSQSTMAASRAGRVEGDHDVERTVVAVHERGGAHLRPVRLQPRGDETEFGERPGPVTVQLGRPPAYLPFEEVLRLPEPRQALAGPVHLRQGRAPVHVGHGQAPAQPAVGVERRGQLEPRGEALDHVHDHEDGSGDCGILAQQPGRGMRHLGAFQRAQDPPFPRGVRRARMALGRRGAAQDPSMRPSAEQVQGVGGTGLLAHAAGRQAAPGAGQPVADPVVKSGGIEGERVVSHVSAPRPWLARSGPRRISSRPPRAGPESIAWATAPVPARSP